MNRFVIEKDASGGYIWRRGENYHIAWGIDLFAVSFLKKDRQQLFEQLQAARYINANTVTVGACWASVEPEENCYCFDWVEECLEMAKSFGFKIILYWHGSNFAAVGNSFIPEYIMGDKERFTRINGPEMRNDSMLCVSNPLLMEKESAAYCYMLQKVAAASYEDDIIALIAGAENNYLGALDVFGGDRHNPPKIDSRCCCEHCEKLYAGEGNIAFMEKQFALYLKNMIDKGANILDLPVLTQTCPWSWFPGWRYAENPVVLKSVINRPNHYVVPSVQTTESTAAFIQDLDRYRDIPGNIPFSSGIGCAVAANSGWQPEMAPWLNLFHYKSAGAIFWDNGFSIKESIVQNRNLRERFRMCFGPLLGIAYHIARLKADPERCMWWGLGNVIGLQKINGVDIRYTASGGDFGVLFMPSQNEYCFAGSTFKGNLTVRFSVVDADSYICERGCYSVNGDWIKAFDANTEIKNGQLVIKYEGNSGDYESVVHRIFLKK